MTTSYRINSNKCCYSNCLCSVEFGGILSVVSALLWLLGIHMPLCYTEQNKQYKLVMGIFSIAISFLIFVYYILFLSVDIGLYAYLDVRMWDLVMF